MSAASGNGASSGMTSMASASQTDGAAAGGSGTGANAGSASQTDNANGGASSGSSSLFGLSNAMTLQVSVWIAVVLVSFFAMLA